MGADLRNETEYLEARADEALTNHARNQGLSRRSVLRAMGFTSVAAWLAACAPQPQGQAPTPSPSPMAVAPSPTPTSAATPPGATPTPPPLFVKPVPPELFRDFGSNREMLWQNLRGRGYVVPNDLFFIRNHSETPRIDAATWKLRVEGSGVARPVEISYDELLSLPSVSVTRFVECGGNGRSLFETFGGRRAAGTQWRLGAMGVAEWTGVPLGAVLERAGLKRTARDVMPEGVDRLKVRRPMSVAKALEDDTLLVYAMNGSPLPPDHGFPVRALVSGWIGISSIKWVGRIEVSEEQLWAPTNTDTYVLIGPGYQPEGRAKGPILSNQNVKSALELAWPATLKPGAQLVRGRSWSSFATITNVDYSIDRGPYRPARLREPNIARAWVRWDFDWEATAGAHTIGIRATDAAGNVQPEDVTRFNEQGYLYNSVVPHPVTVA